MMSTFRLPTTTIDGLSIDAAHSAVPTAAGRTIDSVNSAIAEAETNDRAIVECHPRERRRPARALESGKTHSGNLVRRSFCHPLFSTQPPHPRKERDGSPRTRAHGDVELRDVHDVTYSCVRRV